MFKEWITLWKNKENKPIAKKPRAVPAIEIDTDLANAQYENANEIENMQEIGGHLNDDSHEMEDIIRIEGDEEASSEKEGEDSES